MGLSNVMKSNCWLAKWPMVIVANEKLDKIQNTRSRWKIVQILILGNQDHSDNHLPQHLQHWSRKPISNSSTCLTLSRLRLHRHYHRWGGLSLRVIGAIRLLAICLFQWVLRLVGIWSQRQECSLYYGNFICPHKDAEPKIRSDRLNRIMC